MVVMTKIVNTLVLLGLVLRAPGVLPQSPRRYTQKEPQCRELATIVELIKEARCRPVKQPVPVPVPQGYDAVSPAVVFVNRCQGLACYPSSHSCLPAHLANVTIPVYAHDRNGRRRCLQLTVEEHTGCSCDCGKTCGKNQMVNTEACRCECDPDEQSMCEMRQRLWDPSTCKCVCSPSLVSQCSSGEIFIPELCRCEAY